MFRFSIVESQDQGSFKNMSEDLSDMIKSIFNSKGVEILRSPFTMVLGKNEYINCIGGAYIQRIDIKDLQEDLRELVSALPINGHVLQCTNLIYKCLDKKVIPLQEDIDFYTRGFYRGLYNALIEFGRLKGVNFLIMKISAEAYESTKMHGMWPYVVELKPNHSNDGLFYGILPLTGSHSESYRNVSPV